MNSHRDNRQYDKTISVTSGKLELPESATAFISGTIYLDKSKQEEGQRLSIRLKHKISPVQIKSSAKPFGEVHLNEAIMVGIIPITHLQVFLLSAEIRGNQLDLVISPPKPKLNQLMK